MESFESFEHWGVKVELFQDDDAGDPYENMEQASELLCFEPMHRDGWGKQFPVDEDRPLRALHRWLLLFGGYAVAIPFTFHDYGSGGCRASLVGLDSDRAAGFLVVSQETVAREWEDHPEHGTDVEQAEKCARGEFATWAAWLEGDVAGYVVDRGGPDEDSCWGFYGPGAEKYAGEKARAGAEWAAFERAQRHAQLRTFLLDPDPPRVPASFEEFKREREDDDECPECGGTGDPPDDLSGIGICRACGGTGRREAVAA